jgi:hypothetical protein
MAEFPVDSDPNAPARPESVVTQNFDPKANAQKASVSEQWLPPGVDKNSLPRRAEAMTSAVYRTPGKTTRRCSFFIAALIWCSLPRRPAQR